MSDSIGQVSGGTCGSVLDSVKLGLHLMSGECIAQTCVEPTTTGAELKALAQLQLGPHKPVAGLLAGDGSIRDEDFVARLGLTSADTILIVVGAYCERVRVIPGSGGSPWTYANNIKGSMFLGCGDDFKLINAISGIVDAVSFEAQGKRRHYVMCCNDELVLVRIDDASVDDYRAALVACSFRLSSRTNDAPGYFVIESCLGGEVNVNLRLVDQGHRGSLWQFKQSSGNGPPLLQIP